MLLHEFVAQQLLELNVKVIFGLVGIPITSMAEYLQKGKIERDEKGTRFIAFRNEQAASYAAAYYAYLDGKPSILMTTAGPGLLHALPGIACAKSNGWPLLVISSAYKSNQLDKERFQETSHDAINDFIVRKENDITLLKELYNEARLKNAPVFLELDHDWIASNHDISLPSPEKTFFNSIEHTKDSFNSIEHAKDSLDFHFSSSLDTIDFSLFKKPLVIVGVEAIFKQKENSIYSFIKTNQIPFILMPMAKGSIEIPELNVNAARTMAINEADIIIVFGSNSNWMLPLHKLPQSPKIIMLSRSFVNLPKGSIYFPSIDTNLLKRLESKLQSDSEWILVLLKKCQNNEKIQRIKCLDETIFSYHAVYHILTPFLLSSEKTILIAEGSKTMDIARILLPTIGSKRRLDAAQLAGMGMGLPAVISARLYYPNDPIYCVIGDSAIGFSLSELETIVRYQMSNITILIMNNSGIYHGIESDLFKSLNQQQKPLPTTALYPKFRFDKLVDLFDPINENYVIKGFHVTDRMNLEKSLEYQLASLKIINCVIESLDQ